MHIPEFPFVDLGLGTLAFQAFISSMHQGRRRAITAWLFHGLALLYSCSRTLFVCLSLSLSLRREWPYMFRSYRDCRRSTSLLLFFFLSTYSDTLFCICICMYQGPTSRQERRGRFCAVDSVVHVSKEAPMWLSIFSVASANTGNKFIPPAFFSRPLQP